MNVSPNGTNKVTLSGHRAAATATQSNEGAKQLCTCGIPTSSSGSRGTNSHLIKSLFFPMFGKFYTFLFILSSLSCRTKEKNKIKGFSVLLTVDPPKRQSRKPGRASSCSCQDGDTNNKQMSERGIIMPQRDCVTHVNNLLQLTALSRENHAPPAK